MVQRYPESYKSQICCPVEILGRWLSIFAGQLMCRFLGLQVKDRATICGLLEKVYKILSGKQSMKKVAEKEDLPRI